MVIRRTLEKLWEVGKPRVLARKAVAQNGASRTFKVLMTLIFQSNLIMINYQNLF